MPPVLRLPMRRQIRQNDLERAERYKYGVGDRRYLVGHLSGGTHMNDIEQSPNVRRKRASWVGRFTMGARFGIIAAISGVLAYLPARALDLADGFWSAITAIMVVHAELQATEVLARDQFVGAAIGGVVGMCAALTFGDGLAVFAVAIVVATLACWILNAVSASRLAATTTTIILLVPHVSSPERVAAVRIAEVGWGVCVATAAVWVSARVSAVRGTH